MSKENTTHKESQAMTTVAFRISQEAKLVFDQLAKQEDRHASYFFRKAIEEFVSKEKNADVKAAA